MSTVIFAALFIFVLAALFALSSWLVGRSDKAPGCGGENCCSTCALNSDNQDSKCSDSKCLEKPVNPRSA